MYIGPMGLDNADALTKGIFNHPDIPCIRSGVGSFRMEFYDIGIYPDPCTFFFPEINQTFWNQALGESLYEIERSIEIESILFCLGSQQPVLQRKPVAFSDEEHWVVQVCREYDAIVGGGGADCPLTLHSASPALPRAYHIALEEAVSVVEKNDWFQINRRNLVWNGLAGRMELPHEITQRTTLDIAQ